MPRHSRQTVLRLAGGTDLVSPGAFACDVVADVKRKRPAIVERESVVEAGDSVCLRRRHVQAPARVLQAAPADPPHLVLEAVQHRKEQVPFGANRVPAPCEMIVGRSPLSALPESLGGTK